MKFDCYRVFQISGFKPANVDLIMSLHSLGISEAVIPVQEELMIILNRPISYEEEDLQISTIKKYYESQGYTELGVQSLCGTWHNIT
jgi:hypothetical protein